MPCPASKNTYRIEWSEEDQAHLARCLEFPSLITHGKTPEKALKEIELVVAESIKWIEESGKCHEHHDHKRLGC